MCTLSSTLWTQARVREDYFEISFHTVGYLATGSVVH
jgi:hypothetical protein